VTTPRPIRRRVLLAGAVVVGALGTIGCEPRPGKLRESWAASNEKFSVRVDVFDEGNLAHMFEPGCHVVLEVGAGGNRAVASIQERVFLALRGHPEGPRAVRERGHGVRLHAVVLRRDERRRPDVVVVGRRGAV